MFCSSEKPISRKSPVLPIGNYLSFELPRNVIMYTTPYYPIFAQLFVQWSLMGG